MLYVSSVLCYEVRYYVHIKGITMRTIIAVNSMQRRLIAECKFVGVTLPSNVKGIEVEFGSDIADGALHNLVKSVGKTFVNISSKNGKFLLTFADLPNEEK